MGNSSSTYGDAKLPKPPTNFLGVQKIGTPFDSNYTPPPKEGPSPYTRSGKEIPKLKWGDPDKPLHRTYNNMNLSMHLKEVRERTRGLTPSEREWRKKWVLAQNLHPDEPIRVDAVFRQLNPLRRLYRYPWDKIYEKILEPKMGAYVALQVRAIVPKMMMGVVVMWALWYHLKYESKSWQDVAGQYTKPVPTRFFRAVEIDKQAPGLLEKALQPPKVYTDYGDQRFNQRLGLRQLGESERPW